MKSLPTLALALTFTIAASMFQTVAAQTEGTSTPTTEAQLLSVAGSAKQQTSAPWWQHAVFYEIYPRSFADAKNTGTGNIPGITAKLDYLKDLGVDALWITPCFPSPQVDFGYDISNYCDIAPEYGTLADFDKLVAEAKKRDIKIIMDLVMNHTSDKHPWFVESASSKTNPKRDWFVWKDASPSGGVPNNWQAIFGHSAWKLDPKTNQYYYHFFYTEQPDLNWHNPEVRKAMYDTARFWLDRGVAGFRLDAIQTLFEEPKLTDNPVVAGEKNEYGDPAMKHINNHGLAEVHEVIRELRQVLDSYPDHRVLIGETSAENHEQLSKMYGKDLDEIQLPMNFFFAGVNKLNANQFRKEIAAADSSPVKGWPVYLFSNHDQHRHFNRYGNDKNNDDIAKITATMLLTLRGTPILYYGEEIGMENTDPTRVEDVKDPIGKIGWPKEKGRDGERTPMQWNASKNAGFSDATPWLPVARNYKTRNVEVEQNDPNSVLNFYKALTKLRRTNAGLVDGDYVPLNESDSNVLSYLRKGKSGAVVVSLNMSDKPQVVKLDLSKQGFAGAKAKTLLSSGGAPETAETDQLSLAPYAVYIGQLQ